MVGVRGGFLFKQLTIFENKLKENKKAVGDFSAYSVDDKIQHWGFAYKAAA